MGTQRECDTAEARPHSGLDANNSMRSGGSEVPRSLVEDPVGWLGSISQTTPHKTEGTVP